MFKNSMLAAAFLLMPLTVFPQQIATPDQSDEADKLEKASVELLRDTRAEIEGLRLPENRISFASELASLMWFHDENEARTMYAGVINDFRQLLIGFDNQMNQFGPKSPNDPESSGPIFAFGGDLTERQKVERKFRVAMEVRKSIATAIAEHDPELGLSFFYDSVGVISNPDLRKQIELSDQYLEQQLLQQVAAIDPIKAAQLAKKSLEKGFTNQQVELLKQVYDKDVDKAIDLGAAMLAKLKSEKSDTLDLFAAENLLKYGTQVLDKSRLMNGKKPIYSDSDLRDIAEALSQAVLARPPESQVPYANYAKDVERFQPGRAMQMRSKIPAKAPVRGVNTSASIRGPGVSSSPQTAAANAAKAQQEQNDKKTLDDVMKVSSEKLTTEQRDKIIQQSRATIMLMSGRDKKVMGLSMLAAQVMKAGNKDLAAELMRDASSLVNTQPKNYQDYLLTFMLASGYSTIDSDRSFSLLDDTVSRGNDLIDSAIKIVEFIDLNEDIMSDGELQVGAFGGSMVRQVTRELAGADSTLQTLAKTDFDKMKGVTDRFDRPEVRVLAKMMVLRAVLGNKQPPAAAKTTGKPTQ